MQYDAIIIGGSFAGLSAAMQLGRANRSVCVLDTGRPRNRFAVRSHGFFGQDGAAPLAMLADARQKVAAYPSVSFRDAEATAARANGEGYAVTLSDGEALSGRRLVLAFGLKDRLPDIPGMTERWGRSVLHCPYCHGYEFLGRPLGVLSVIPQSVHQAELITEWGPTTFFLNGGAMPDEATRARLSARGVTLEPERVVSLEGQAPDLAGLRLADGRLVEVSALYLAPDSRPQSPIAEQLGCTFEDAPFGRIIRTDALKRTGVPGVFAAGDITRMAHNATFASADGVQAGASVHQSLVFGQT
ncbi:NAD(P)/FAD-dependent oxidoreductase [Nitratireductor sp. ZSWI3]|uniref:NAD(P)/FAD-dependent oxidoreductase n=1 Tax=Nitratireductor sp. ZSWI3 TaxID=2966359 RepID=UPI00214F7635|nr:NAD(P)/FAD-dependent oxidoreductase [Nitratireductor sp. ZSWI3]MCR4267875.1 NAD(P)/FAD-dependent oxidoreductase [Nitratireductor sp. ZSWI3]